MAKKKNKNTVAKDFLKTLRVRPENHILKKTNNEIQKIMEKISYLANYTQLLMAYQIKNQNKRGLSVAENQKFDIEINMLIEEVHRLSMLAQVKNKTIETKMIKKYEYETEPSCQ
tara:strand:+ start:432 stop:776 length:345 start_codon:yes stop_codon:yes gene_type:complete